ncbi:hypothetical protein CGSSp9BS68_00722, partial [Streptococcus pneumoniae SP9-BS68]
IFFEKWQRARKKRPKKVLGLSFD